MKVNILILTICERIERGKNVVLKSRDILFPINLTDSSRYLY